MLGLHDMLESQLRVPPYTCACFHSENFIVTCFYLGMAIVDKIARDVGVV